MSDVKRAVQLAELLLTLRQRVDRLESELAAAKADAQRVEQEDLPELMQELGLSKFSLTTGETLEVQPDVACSISDARPRTRG